MFVLAGGVVDVMGSMPSRVVDKVRVLVMLLHDPIVDGSWVNVVLLVAGGSRSGR